MKISHLPSTCRHSDFVFLPSWENFKAYTFCFLIYTDWLQLPDVFYRLRNDNTKFYAVSPLHDKDFKSDGTPDKPHYHVVVRFWNQRYAYALAREYLLSCKVEKCESFRGAVRYLIHLDDPNKFQYDRYQILTSNWEICAAQFVTRYTSKNSDEVDECLFIDELSALIRQSYFDSEMQIASWVLKNGYGRWFTKYKFQIHNEFYQFCIKPIHDKKNLEKR